MSVGLIWWSPPRPPPEGLWKGQRRSAPLINGERWLRAAD
ncbi:hypothetical protein M3J09_004383 [Ascochyta lentis]